MQRTDWWFPETRDGGWRKMGGGGSKGQIFNYKLNKSWGCVIFLKFNKKVDV